MCFQNSLLKHVFQNLTNRATEAWYTNFRKQIFSFKKTKLSAKRCGKTLPGYYCSRLFALFTQEK